MSRRQHFPTLGEQDNQAEVTQPEAPALPLAKWRSARWSARRRHNAWLLLIALLLGVVTISVLAGGMARPSGQARGAQSPTSPVRTTKAQPPTPSAIVATGEFREFPLPQSDSQVMRLALDHHGRIWFGEMGRNYLAVFDPRTQTFEQMTPPHGRYGMMGIQVAPDDTIWFAEQYANYIGHYFPTTKQFQVYPLPRLTTPDPGNPGKTLSLPSAPQDLTFDTHGNLWFTEFNADSLGRLDLHTGRIQHYPLSAKKSVQVLDPYGVTVDQEGMVWFTEATNNHVGRLDPTTGRLSFFTPQGPNTPLMEIASDPHGIIWITSFSSGLLLRLDPRTGTFTPYSAPSAGGDAGGLYGLVVTATGQVWVTVPAENAIARLDVAANYFVYYHIPTSGSLPIGIAMDANHSIWFTEVDKIGMLRP
jgi:virginiamycin B lyase